MIKFKNGSSIEVIDTHNETKRGKIRELDLGDIDWFCGFIGWNLFYYQKFILWLKCHKEISRCRKIVSKIKIGPYFYCHGKWVTEEPHSSIMVCSVCFELPPTGEYGQQYLTRYCPNCGAKMDADVQQDIGVQN